MNFPSVQRRIIYEDNHLLIVNKMPGELVQGDKTGDSPLLEDLREYIRQSADKQGNVFMGLTHRLDRPCSGVVVFAKTSKALERMNAIFREGLAEKIYWAVSEFTPDPPDGTLTHFLKKNEKQNKSYVVDKGTPGSKEAVLHYKLLQTSDRYALSEIQLITGRHHQIRVQLSVSGWPVKGDLKYGASRSNKDGSVHLHAFSLSFIHPVKKQKMRFTAFPPVQDSLWKFFMQNCSESMNKSRIIVENETGRVEIIHVNEVSGD
jgi:23S rRNA pseudouridine1911/1915/1917 synthase